MLPTAPLHVPPEQNSLLHCAYNISNLEGKKKHYILHLQQRNNEVFPEILQV